jgi:uncharacterized Zn ribbon protein
MKDLHRCPACDSNLSHDEERRQHCDSCGYDWSKNVSEEA